MYPVLKFEEAYSVCGGRIFLPNTFMKEWCEEKGEGLIGKNLEDFSMVLQEQRRLIMALYSPTKFKSPKWTKEELLGVMEMLTKCDSLCYNKLCEEFDKEVVDSMIECNLMHLRPTSSLAFDVLPHNTPIVTAESQAAGVAMEKILSEFKK